MQTALQAKVFRQIVVPLWFKELFILKGVYTWLAITHQFKEANLVVFLMIIDKEHFNALSVQLHY